MSQLTKEQIEAAVQHARMMWGNGERNWNQIMADVAPYLQLPWDEATQEEGQTFLCNASSRYPVGPLNKFIYRRNAALLPKVDERVEVVRSILYLADRNEPDLDVAKRILAALDKVRP